MHVTLVLPELGAAIAQGDASAQAISLARLVGRGALHVEPDGWAAALAPLYGVARQQDWPLAPLRATRHGLDAAGAYWLRAIPVTMVPGRTDVHVEGAARVAVEDAQALLAMLNAHFAPDGLQFIALAPDEWVARIARAPALATRALDTIVGQPLRSLLPTGGDAGEWRRWEQEMQMLLHAHPVNAAREARGEAPVNGLWFDEGGTLPQASSHEDVVTFGGDSRIAALARFTGSEARPAPAALDAALAMTARPQRAVLVPDTADVAALDAAFAAPADAALRSGKLASVAVMTAGPRGTIASWTARAPRMLQRLLGGGAKDLRVLVEQALAATER